MWCFVFILALTFFQDIPLKPTEEFEVKLDYQFKQRPVADRNAVLLGKAVVPASGSVLPYLVLNIKLLRLQEQKMRVYVSTNLDERIRSKRVEVQDIVELDLGFTDDMIDRVTAHAYTLTFLTSEKEPVNKIVISVGEDGSFLVNGEKRGAF